MRRILAALLVAPLLVLAASGWAEMRAGDLIGKDVVDARGEHAGRVKDVIFDARDGSIRRVTIEHGGWLGIGGREVALSAAQLAPGGGSIVLDAAAGAALSSAPVLKEPVWPAMRASALIGRDVQDSLHRESGEIADLALDLGAGRVLRALIDLRGGSTPGSGLVEVPIEQLSLPRDMGRFATLAVPREWLAAQGR